MSDEKKRLGRRITRRAFLSGSLLVPLALPIAVSAQGRRRHHAPTGGLPQPTARFRRTSYIEEKFLPILKLHPREDNQPSLVSWLLPRAELRFKGHPSPILRKGEVTSYNLDKQTFNGHSSGGGASVSDFYLDYPHDADLNATRHGNIDEFACYVHISRRSPLEIQYYFYYPYNGSIAPVLDIAHEGDWEHITVRVNAQGTAADQIYYHAHDDQHSRWVPAAGHVNGDGRPIVYSAYHTHGCYPSAGSWPTAAPTVNDETAEGGPEIDYYAEGGWRSLDVPAPLFDWVNYNGKWGAPGATEASSGFPGPKYQPEWNGDHR